MFNNIHRGGKKNEYIGIIFINHDFLLQCGVYSFTQFSAIHVRIFEVSKFFKKLVSRMSVCA